jgi:hypothetical protein
MTTHWLGLTVSLITATALVGCGGGTHELGTSPDAGASSAAGSTGASGGASGGSALDAPVAGGSGGASASGGVMSTSGAGRGGTSTASAGAGGSSSVCCNMLACPGGYTLIGVVAGEARSSTSVTCPVGAKCQTFTTSCGCNTVLCAEPADAGVADAAGGQGGQAGGSGTGGAGGTSGSTCPMVPPCNWCGGTPITDANGCVTDWLCANGARACSTQSCSESSPCAAGQTCRDRLCWPSDAGAGGGGGTGGTGGSSGSCGPMPNCNWCGGEMLKDANGCFAGYRCANGIDPCKTSSCSASAPCAAGYTCSNMLCWPNDGGTETLCGGKVCGANEVCCGPHECGRCIEALTGPYCPSICTTQACGPSGAACKTGEVCLDVVYQTTTTRTGTASCQPNPCGSDPLSCTCAKSLCTGATSCTSADPATGAVVCSTK